MELPPDLLHYIAIGFAAQLVDGALGMAYGVTASSLLLGLGLPPAVPLGAWLVKRVRLRPMLVVVGLLVIGLSLRTLLKHFGLI